MHPIPKARFEQFSDGVFAIAITLLAIELRSPVLHHLDLTRSIRELLPLLPTLLTFVISFVTIAIFWVNHHQLTHLVQHIDRRRILWSNVLFLLFLTIIPFVTQGVSTYPFHPLTVLAYSLVFLGASVSFSLLRYYIHRSLGELSIPMIRSIFGPVLYILAAISALISIELSYVLLAIPAIFYFLPKGSA